MPRYKSRKACRGKACLCDDARQPRLSGGGTKYRCHRLRSQIGRSGRTLAGHSEGHGWRSLYHAQAFPPNIWSAFTILSARPPPFTSAHASVRSYNSLPRERPTKKSPLCWHLSEDRGFPPGKYKTETRLAQHGRTYQVRLGTGSCVIADPVVCPGTLT